MGDEKVEEEKEDVKVEVKKEPSPVKKAEQDPQAISKSEEDPDASADDVLKLDATAEVDEFSAFLNEFEDEVLTENKAKESVVKREKTVLEEECKYDRKVVNGKKLRKKIRVKPSRAANPQSPEGWKYSPGRKTRSPDSKRNRSPLSRGPPFKRSRTSKTPDKHAEDK